MALLQEGVPVRKDATWTEPAARTHVNSVAISPVVRAPASGSVSPQNLRGICSATAMMPVLVSETAVKMCAQPAAVSKTVGITRGKVPGLSLLQEASFHSKVARSW